MSQPRVSFEIFPPANTTASFRLCQTMGRLAMLDPDYVSVTYGAQGGVQDRTLDTARAVMEQTGLPVCAHLTAARASKAEVLERAESFHAAGITQIVALRGDPESGAETFAPHPDGFASSLDLVTALAEQNRFRIRVGAYPESHPSATSMQQNIDFLKAKFDAGADEAITQFFFEADTFLRFRDACAKAGIEKPLIPGILPPASWTGTRKFAQKCGTAIPDWLDQAFETAIRDNREQLFALAVTTELCSKLIDEGVAHLHVYTLNAAEMTEQLCAALQITPEQPKLRNVA